VREPKNGARYGSFADRTGDASVSKSLSPSESGIFGADIWEQTFALSKLARGLFSPADSLALLAHSFLRRLFIGPPPLDLAEKTFALELLFQNSQGLIDIVVANENFQSGTPFEENSVCEAGVRTAAFYPRPRMLTVAPRFRRTPLAANFLIRAAPSNWAQQPTRRARLL
jgi:hypothetical protein